MQAMTMGRLHTAAEERLLGEVRRYMREIVGDPAAHTETGAVIGSALGTAGKMLRARLLLECAAFGPDAYARRDRLCMLAAMVELVHLASLVHDDIIDDAPLRRGCPSVQSRYGKDAAVYAGDLMIARVFLCAAQEGLADAAACLAGTIEEMCAGEIGQAACRYREDTGTDEYFANIRGKTASLFRAACVLGAAETGCTDSVLRRLGCFGETLGILFQLHDDLLDFSGREAGKETHRDFQDGIYTLPVLLALQSSGGRAALLPLMRGSREQQLTGDELRRMEREVVRHGGVEQSWAVICRYLETGGALLDTFEDGEPLRALRKVWCQLGRR